LRRSSVHWPEGRSSKSKPERERGRDRWDCGFGEDNKNVLRFARSAGETSNELGESAEEKGCAFRRGGEATRLIRPAKAAKDVKRQGKD